jgi:hypothetical protein
VINHGVENKTPAENSAGVFLIKGLVDRFSEPPYWRIGVYGCLD